MPRARIARAPWNPPALGGPNLTPGSRGLRLGMRGEIGESGQEDARNSWRLKVGNLSSAAFESGLNFLGSNLDLGEEI